MLRFQCLAVITFTMFKILVYCVSMLTFDNCCRMGLKNRFQIVQSIGKCVTMFLMSFIDAGKDI